MQELRFEIVVDPDLGPGVENVVAIGAFQTPDGTAVIYGDWDLMGFYSDLLLGRPLPLTLTMRQVDTLGKLLSIILFLNRDLAIHPQMLSLVSSVSFVDRHKLVGLAHVDPELARFFKFLVGYLPPDIPQEQQKDRIVTVVGWVREYLLEGRLPALPPASPPPKVFDVGTNGFVLAETDRSLDDGWEALFRQGYLRGALFSPDKNGRRTVLVARKSCFLAFNLKQAAEVLNEAEKAMGEPPGWATDEKELWLEGPPEGTLLMVSAISQVLVRV